MAKKGKSDSKPSKKIFVLDTSVILYDHDAINNFHEHDVAIPIQVLEELDNFKSGNDTRNFEARSFIRLIDLASKQKLISDWIALTPANSGKFRVILNEKPLKTDAEEIYGKGKTDHKILNAALSLEEENPDKRVVLVSKDICLRLKAKALNLNAEDYETGKIKNVDELYAGKTELINFPESIIDEVKKQKFIDAADIGLPPKEGNHFYILKNKRKTANVFYNHNLKTISAVSTDAVFKIKPKNIEQAFAIDALLNP
ncbi:MAG: ribonuclease, partial [Pedobacter sp.]